MEKSIGSSGTAGRPNIQTASAKAASFGDDGIIGPGTGEKKTKPRHRNLELGAVPDECHDQSWLPVGHAICKQEHRSLNM